MVVRGPLRCLGGGKPKLRNLPRTGVLQTGFVLFSMG